MHFVCIMGRRIPMIKSYDELVKYKTFEERFEYAKLRGSVGDSIFGFHRFINQLFYSSRKWKSIRSKVIIRDDGCDLGCLERPILTRVYIHHLNPVTLEQLESEDSCLYSMDNLICVSYDTHLALHYGDINLLPPSSLIERKPGDTTLW